MQWRLYLSGNAITTINEDGYPSIETQSIITGEEDAAFDEAKSRAAKYLVNMGITKMIRFYLVRDDSNYAIAFDVH